MSNYSGDKITFGIGEAVNTTFSVLHRALGKFIAAAILPMIPLVLLGVGIASAGSENMMFLLGVCTVLYLMLSMVVQAATVYGALEEMRGVHWTLGDAFSKGLRRFWPVLGVALVFSLAVMLGFALLLIPGVIALCMFYVAVPACVVEEWGVTQSMTRSAELTKGYRWPILGLVLILVIGSTVVSNLLSNLLVIVLGPTVGIIAGLVIQIYLTALLAILPAVIYYRLRMLKDGVDLERIATVFD